jgi:large-conductance mechanosensitive channel
MADQKLASEAKPLDKKTDAELKREAKVRLKRLDPREAADVADEVAPKGTMSCFVTFLRERAVVGLAIGFVIGTQVQTVVKQFIASFVDPLFKLLIPGDQALSTRTWTLGIHGHTADFAWGALLYSLLDFLFILFTIYFVVKLLHLDRLDKKN